MCQITPKVKLFSSLCVTLLLALLMSLAHGEVTQCSQSHTQPKLRFVAQLSVNGCPIFVHDTGANDGPHLAVEPLMCVTQSLHKVLPRYDPVTQQTYVSVPVMLRNDTMLTEVEHQLRHLSPKSVKFATVSDINVFNNNSLRIHALTFIWSPDESVGFLRVGCAQQRKSCSIMFLALRLQSTHFEDIEGLQLVANITANGSCSQHPYRVQMQNQSFTNPEFHFARYKSPPTCNQLRYTKSIHVKNCTARVHQRLDMKGHFLIEPLLCHNITSITNESIMYDYSRDMYHLKLDVVLQDDITLDAVRSKLAHLSPLRVSFMRLWRAESVVSSVLSGHFVIGGLMMSGDWKLGQMRVYCRTRNGCKSLISWIITEPVNLWRHIRWSITAVLTDECVIKIQAERFSHRMLVDTRSRSSGVWNSLLKLEKCPFSPSADCKFIKPSHDGVYVVIQQRLMGSVSFQRGWSEYVNGFGDGTDFWIGLSTIHSLSINGATLRVEMKLWNGTELHAEYAGFKVGDANTNYIMTYRDMIRHRSSVSYDAMTYDKGMQFSTMDRDNDQNSGGSCSNSFGKAGWWWYNCGHANPNGVYGTSFTAGTDVSWYSGLEYLFFREVRLMLQI